MIPLLPIGLTIASPCRSSCSSHMCSLLLRRSSAPMHERHCRARNSSRAEVVLMRGQGRLAESLPRQGPSIGRFQQQRFGTRVGHVYMPPLSRSIDIGLERLVPPRPRTKTSLTRRPSPRGMGLSVRFVQRAGLNIGVKRGLPKTHKPSCSPKSSMIRGSASMLARGPTDGPSSVY